MASAVTVTEGPYASAAGDSFVLAAGVGVFATRFASVSKRFAAPAPLRASRASRVSVSSRVSVFFIVIYQFSCVPFGAQRRDT